MHDIILLSTSDLLIYVVFMFQAVSDESVIYHPHKFAIECNCVWVLDHSTIAMRTNTSTEYYNLIPYHYMNAMKCFIDPKYPRDVATCKDDSSQKHCNPCAGVSKYMHNTQFKICIWYYKCSSM